MPVSSRSTINIISLSLIWWGTLTLDLFSGYNAFFCPIFSQGNLTEVLLLSQCVKVLPLPCSGQLSNKSLSKGALALLFSCILFPLKTYHFATKNPGERYHWNGSVCGVSSVLLLLSPYPTPHLCPPATLDFSPSLTLDLCLPLRISEFSAWSPNPRLGSVSLVRSVKSRDNCHQLWSIVSGLSILPEQSRGTSFLWTCSIHQPSWWGTLKLTHKLTSSPNLP